jgi:sirohydrochlorin cobaltochelatase
MAEPMTGTLLIVPGGDTVEARPQPVELARALAARLGQPVVPCLAEGSGGPVVAGIRQLVACGVQRLVAIPLLLPPERDGDRGVTPAIQWASRRWPFLTFHSAAPLDWPEWACLLRQAALDALAATATCPRETAVLIAGAGGPAPLTNADLARLAHLVAAASEFARVDYAFLDTARPRVPDVVALLARLGLRDLVVVPWLLAPGDPLRRLSDQAEQAARALDLRATVAATPLAHPVFLEILVSHHQAALADASLLGPTWEEILSEIAQGVGARGHGPGQAVSPEEEAQLRELERKINEMLPPQYQGRYEKVSPESMGTAPLTFDLDGQVAWDKMWTSFCDLAIAGGPPHRGTLLEAVPAADALAEPEKYQAVLTEIERGIRLVTGLPVVPSKAPGWVVLRCDSEEMALWVMRAIIVENVMVRREGEVIYLPAGPQFTLKREIKNVVTVVAKTCHYWTAHLVARRRTDNSPGGCPRTGVADRRE